MLFPSNLKELFYKNQNIDDMISKKMWKCNVIVMEKIEINSLILLVTVM